MRFDGFKGFFCVSEEGVRKLLVGLSGAWADVKPSLHVTPREHLFFLEVGHVFQL